MPLIPSRSPSTPVITPNTKSRCSPLGLVVNTCAPSFHFDGLRLNSTAGRRGPRYLLIGGACGSRQGKKAGSASHARGRARQAIPSTAV